jgi:hypothetical protein
MRQLQALQN